MKKTLVLVVLILAAIAGLIVAYLETVSYTHLTLPTSDLV